MKEETKRKILLLFICAVTLIILYSAVRISDKRKEELLLSTSISEHLTEVKYNMINDYVVEEPNAIIYVSNSSEKKTKNFEKIFIPVIKKYNLENSIVFINIYEANIEDQFYQNAPELVFYKDSEVTDVVDASTLSTKKDIINILKERSVISD